MQKLRIWKGRHVCKKAQRLDVRQGVMCDEKVTLFTKLVYYLVYERYSTVIKHSLFMPMANQTFLVSY